MRRPLSSFYLGKSATSLSNAHTADTFHPETYITRDANPKRLKVFVTSWNMGNAEAQGMQTIFDERHVTADYDIIVIGLQESTYTVKQSNTDSIAHLQAEIMQMIGYNYYKVEHCYRAQLQLYIFARQGVHVTDVQASIENTGFLHVFPNKGGVLVSFSVERVRFAFISTHLTAHEGAKNCAHRNASVAEILGGARTGDKHFDVTNQCHYVFWMGDLNYRLTFDPETPVNTKKNIAQAQEQQKQQAISEKQVNFDIEGVEVMEGMNDDSESGSDDELVDGGPSSTTSNAATSPKSPKSAKKEQWNKVLDMVKGRQWDELMNLDELNREIKAGRVFNGFVALQPTFPPTFKRTRELVLDLLPFLPSAKDSAAAVDLKPYYHPKRIPSYTDRILYKTLSPQLSVKTLFFESCEYANSSDHKPVRAGFEVSLLPQGHEDIYVDRELIRHLLPTKTVLPLGSVLRHLHFKVTDLKGFDLEEMDSQMFGGKSDPYIVIYSDPPSLLMHGGKVVKDNSTGVRSKVIKHNINPEWKETLDLYLASLDLQGMAQHASLNVTVWDEDFSNYDDLIGAFTISLKDILMATIVKGEAYTINSFIYCNSEIMGRVTGKIHLDGHMDDILQACRVVAQERENQIIASVRYIPLQQAEIEAMQVQQDCRCTVS